MKNKLALVTKNFKEKWNKDVTTKAIDNVQRAWSHLSENNLNAAQRYINRSYSKKNKITNHYVKHLIESIHSEMTWYITDTKLGESKQERNITYNFLSGNMNKFESACGEAKKNQRQKLQKELLNKLVESAKNITDNSFKQKNRSDKLKMIKEMQSITNKYISTYNKQK